MAHASLQRPTVEFHSREPGLVTVEFEQGTVDLEKKNLETSGAATVRMKDGYVITSRDVSFDGETDRLTTASGFTVEGARVRVEGKNLTVYPGQRRFEASEAIRVIYYPSPERQGEAG
jgi:hypothetical protein